MEIWAAVDVLDGRCVQLRGGDPETARFAQDPLKAARHWMEEGADGLHLIDLNAALGAGSNRETLAAILRAVDIPVQVGGGVRDERAIERWLTLGAERVIVGTRGVRDRQWLRAAAAEFPEQIVLALDARGDEVVTSGWAQGSGRHALELAREVDEFGLAALLFTNVDIEGSLTGLDPKPIEALCAGVQTPVLVSGGVKDAEDVRLAWELGASGVVLGTALYAGTVRLAELASAAASMRKEMNE